MVLLDKGAWSVPDPTDKVPQDENETKSSQSGHHSHVILVIVEELGRAASAMTGSGSTSGSSMTMSSGGAAVAGGIFSRILLGVLIKQALTGSRRGGSRVVSYGISK